MTDQPTDPIGETTPETARALLWRHGLPEDVIDGALCLHAQELAAVQRREAAVWGVDTAAGKRVLATADLIDPTTGATQPVVPVSSPPPDQTADRDRYAEVTAAARAEANRLALSEALGLGTGAPWAAIRERVAVLAVLPPPADRAAVLLWAADFAEEVAEKLRAHHEFERSTGALDVMTELRRHAAECPQCGTTGACNGGPCPLRRLAAEAPQPDTETLAAATCSAQYHGTSEEQARLCIRAAQHVGKSHTDEHGFHWSDTVAVYPVADGTFRTGINVRAVLAAEQQPVQHAPGIAVCCPDCRAKGHAVCVPDTAAPAAAGPGRAADTQDDEEAGE